MNQNDHVGWFRMCLSQGISMSFSARQRAVVVQWGCGILLCLGIWGCRSHTEVKFDKHGAADYLPFGTQIEYPDACVQPASAVLEMPPPNTLREPDPEEYWELTLEEAIRIGLANSEVMRSLGVSVVAAPGVQSTVYDPALQIMDPRSGEEAALSAFDAQFTTSLFFDRDERAFNNAIFGGGASSLHQNQGLFEAELAKVAATGTRFAVRNQTIRNSNSAPIATPERPFGNLFPSVYDTLFEMEFRHPLLQGSGLTFNRIAGPNGLPGVYNGIVIARLRTDIALADFEAAVRDFVTEIQREYWFLYFAYRNLDARIAARDSAQETWRTANTELEFGASDIVAESLSRDQFYLFQAQVADALNGTASVNSTSRTGPGVYDTERRLRFLMGVPLNDGRLIRPADEPSKAGVVFDWNESLNEAMFRRVELRRQNWTIKQRELELLAARNQLLMRLDLVGLYRWRGFGDELFGERWRPNGSAFDDLFQGDLQGWNLGLQLTTPVGNRIGHVAVRQAELALVRERALVREQERQISRELSDALGELERAYHQTRVNYNRAVATRQRLAAEKEKYRLGAEGGLLQFVVEAESRVAEADSEYYRSLVDYNLSLLAVHYAKGTLLDYVGVSLSEGPWSAAAYRSAAKESRRFAPRMLDYCITEPCPVSRGPYQQHVLPRDESEIVPLPPATEEPTPIAPEPMEGAPLPDPFESDPFESDLLEPEPFELDPAVDPPVPTEDLFE